MSKEIDEMYFPENVKYAENHEWARREGDCLRIGISDYAQDQLGEIVYVEMPEVGGRYEAKSQFATLESIKAVSEILYAGRRQGHQSKYGRLMNLPVWLTKTRMKKDGSLKLK